MVKLMGFLRGLGVARPGGDAKATEGVLLCGSQDMKERCSDLLVVRLIEDGGTRGHGIS